MDGSTYSTFNVPNSGDTQVYGINDSGLIVGIYIAGSNADGFLKDGSTFTTIATGYGINDSGLIVGGNLLIDGSTVTTIDVPGATNTEASGINNSGEIVGTYANVLGGTSRGSSAHLTLTPARCHRQTSPSLQPSLSA